MVVPTSEVQSRTAGASAAAARGGRGFPLQRAGGVENFPDCGLPVIPGKPVRLIPGVAVAAELLTVETVHAQIGFADAGAHLLIQPGAIAARMKRLMQLEHGLGEGGTFADRFGVLAGHRALFGGKKHPAGGVR